MEEDELKARLSYNIKRIRKQARLSQEKLAEKAGLASSTIQSIEECRMWPSGKTLLLISDALDSDVYTLFLPDGNSADIQNNIYKKVHEAFEKGFRDYMLRHRGHASENEESSFPAAESSHSES